MKVGDAVVVTAQVYYRAGSTGKVVQILHESDPGFPTLYYVVHDGDHYTPRIVGHDGVERTGWPYHEDEITLAPNTEKEGV